jgi:hypothetical protein
LAISGRRFARIDLAFGMKVIAWSQNMTAESGRMLGQERADLGFEVAGDRGAAASEAGSIAVRLTRSNTTSAGGAVARISRPLIARCQKMSVPGC